MDNPKIDISVFPLNDLLLIMLTIFFSNFLIKKCGQIFLKNTFTPLKRFFFQFFLENKKYWTFNNRGKNKNVSTHFFDSWGHDLKHNIIYLPPITCWESKFSYNVITIIISKSINSKPFINFTLTSNPITPTTRMVVKWLLNIIYHIPISTSIIYSIDPWTIIST